jgi:hypothetical protein
MVKPGSPLFSKSPVVAKLSPRASPVEIELKEMKLEDHFSKSFETTEPAEAAKPEVVEVVSFWRHDVFKMNKAEFLTSFPTGEIH